jgi:outer membrane immunogenic protein
MSKRLSIATFIAIASAGGAHAAGPEPVVAEPVIVAAPVAPFWEGGYVGAQLGYAYGDFDLDDATDGDDDGDGVIGGITAGYLWSVGNGWYVGPEFQYDWADVDVSDGDDEISLDEIARLKLIAGREVAGGQGLVYGSGGIAYSSLDSAGDIFDGFDGSDTNWVLGLGYDHRVGENWTVGAEYQYHDFDDINVNTIHLKAAYRF